MKKILHSHQGIGLIGTIALVAAASGIIYVNMNSLIDRFANLKENQRSALESTKFLNGLLHYTTYAVKNRWCLNDNWGRNQSCEDGSLQEAVTNTKNLERLLWSKVAAESIKGLYQDIYGSAPPAIRLNQINANIKVDSLSKLGSTHPLNLSLSRNVQKCVESVTIKIDKKISASNPPIGDEVPLIISIEAHPKKSLLNTFCDKYEQGNYLIAETVFYPRTLNQFALIKASNFDLEDYPGGENTKGLNIYGATYVEQDINIPDSDSFNPVAFYGKVVVGGGRIRQKGKLYNPESFGSQEDRLFLSDDLPFRGFRSGVASDPEVDPGLSPLFGEAFKYPEGSIINKCIKRNKLKNNLFETRDSRLFARSTSDGLELGLSKSNEFRKTAIESNPDPSSDYFLFSKNGSNSNDYLNKRIQLDYEKREEGKLPILRVKLGYNYQTNLRTFYMDRNTQIKISFIDHSFFNNALTELSKDEESYLDINQLRNLSTRDSLYNDYEDLERTCEKAEDKGVFHPKCNRVLTNQVDNKTDCDDGGGDDGGDDDDGGGPLGKLKKKFSSSKCEDYIDDIEDDADDLNDTVVDYRDDVSDIVSNPPSLTLSTGGDRTTKLDLKTDWDNRDTIDDHKWDILRDLSDISLEVNAFDFGIEGTNDPIKGARFWQQLPGPNEKYDSNELHLSTSSYERVRNADGDRIYSSWKHTKEDDDSDDKPDDGLSIAEAEELDEKCKSIEDVEPVDWDISFTDQTQFSWLYNVTSSGIAIEDPSKVEPLDEYNFSMTHMGPGNYQGTPTRSIVKKCVVEASLNYVFGFYVCETLEIEPRSKPLNIIGTIILNDLNISSSALNQGVNFYSLWEPKARKILREAGHITRPSAPFDPNACQNFSTPGWSETLTEQQRLDLEQCSPMKFIYEGANNFTWTTVDPDIGLEATDSLTTQSKIPNRYRRFNSEIVWSKIPAKE